MTNQFLALHDTSRRAGFEFEFTGISIENCAELLANEYNARMIRDKALKYVIEGTPIGKIQVESDCELAQKITDQKFDDLPMPLARYIRRILKKTGQVSTFFLPWEIITEPLEWDQLPALEHLRNFMLRQQAKGSSESIAYAFGTHINCEAGSTEVEDVRDTVRAFIVFYDKLLSQLHVDPSRRISTLILPYPDSYARIVLSSEYNPSWSDFIRHYLRENNTRNRALDLLPLIGYLFPEKINDFSDYSRSRLSPRPTYHYRLPNCEFSNPEWRVAHAWNSWVEIDALAHDKQRLAMLCKDKLAEINHPWKSRLKKWWRRLGSHHEIFFHK